MNSSVRLRAKGDGKKRSEDIVVEAVNVISKSPETAADFARHPILSAISPESLLGKISRKRATRLIESGILSGETELVPDTIFPRGEELDVFLPLSILLSELDLLPPSAALGTEALPVLYEDDFFFAVDKPNGLPSAPLRSDDLDSAVQRVLAQRPAFPILRGNPLEPGLVHRLDTGTSGVLLFAKSLEAFARVDRAWNSGSVRKVYRALAQQTGDEEPKLTMGKIEIALGHDLKSKKRMRAVTGPADLKKIRGEPNRSISEILTVRRLGKRDGGRAIFDVEIRIETGVHHQIRATLAHLGVPILGDPTYGGAPSERVWLHAWKLVLPAEAGKKPLEIVAPLPAQWSHAG